MVQELLLLREPIIQVIQMIILFNASAGSLTVIWAVGASSTTYASGHSTRGVTALSVSLGVYENNLLSF